MTMASPLAARRIYVAGHRGLVGSAVWRALERAGCQHLIGASHAELDLTDRDATRAFFELHAPEAVIVCAATVGGIKANSTRPVDFLMNNLDIQNNVISSAHALDVSKLVFLGSSCIYPRDCPQPMSETALLSGPLEATNRPYALAKIAGIELCWSYNRQFGRRYVAAMPTNLFGPGDNYDLDGSHVLPALIRRMHEAKLAAAPSVKLWGTGTPLREFLYSDDLAHALLYLLTADDEMLAPLFNDASPPLVNVGYGAEISIRALAERIAVAVGYQGGIDWDATQPDGTPRKLLDSTLIESLGWRPSVALDEGIRLAYDDFLSRS
jgi:GDP-L-fucose synthase